MYFSVKYKKIPTADPKVFLKDVYKLEVYHVMIGGWTLPSEDYRLYSRKMHWKRRALKEKFPADPDATMDFSKPPLDESTVSLVLDEDLPAAPSTRQKDMPPPPPKPTPGPSTPRDDPSKKKGGNDEEDDDHPDPKGGDRIRRMEEYLKKSEDFHDVQAAEGEFFGINYCEKYLARKKKSALDAIKKGELNCKVCKQQFYSTQNLRNHTRVHHTDDRKHACGLCDHKPYGDSQSLKNHLAEKHGILDKKKPPSLLKCRFCEEKDEVWETYVRGKYNAHIKEHTHVAKDGRYKCQYCPKDYAQKRTKDIHERDQCPNRPGADDDDDDDEEEGAKGGQYECPVCGKRMTTKRSIPRHCKNKHPDYYQKHYGK